MTTDDGRGREDIDARFADIVAHWDDPPKEAREDDTAPEEQPRRTGPGTPLDPAPGGLAVAPRPEEGPEPSVGGPVPDRDPSPGHAPGRSSDLTSGRGLGVGPAGPYAGGDAHAPRRAEGFDEPVPWRQHVPPEDPDDETFTPPPPQPLPAFLGDWPFYLALGGLVLGPLLLVLLVMFAPTERHLMWVAAALTIAGFLTLVMRQPHDRDPDDTDDGARV